MYISKASDYCCIGAVLETILKRHNYFDFNQFDIINEFGLTVPKKANISDKISNITYSENKNDWGVKLELDSLNEFFKKNEILLKELYIPINTIADYSFELTLKSISEEFDVVFGFDYGRLYKIPDSYDIGHVGIFLNIVGNTVRYLDPGPKNHGVQEVNVDDLYYAIKSKSDGLWLMKSTGQNNVL